MTPSEIVYRLLKETNTTQGELASALGYKSPATISNRLNRDGMTARTFLEMVDALGYELTVRPKVVTDVKTEITVTVE